MQKVLKISNLKSKETDYNFWLNQPIQERLNTIEILRQQYINFNKNVQPRLQRFCTIINKAQR